MKYLLTVLLLAAISLPILAKAESKPLHAQARTLEAAAPLCAANNGVFKLRPIGGKWYRLTCQDQTMIRVTIKVDKKSNYVAVLTN